MIRIKDNFKNYKKHKKILKLSKGFIGSNSKIFKISNQKIMKALYFSFSDRKKKKRSNKKIWINRINYFLKNYFFNNFNYNKIINKIKLNKICINKKILSEIIINDYKTIYKLKNMLT
uniref:Large ribosomal subunit protein bL20c n=1 Tax=Euglena longa TaxID=3037 RepID=RK20_EUGLO|nr:ribosomal protein L20 [Euglena longa]P34769.1 RecName: Full=Large ribosomal subunit protein bL20c; AltName: Full=50S ribosomal protein L20, plastid [Euglena longa]CAC24590.1 ribosomal protein L20 [Euglena longa]